MRGLGRGVLSVALGAATAAGVPGGLTGQGLADRMASYPAASVAFDVEVREGVEVCERGLRRGENHWMWRDWNGRSGPDGCGAGPLRVVVERDRAGRVVDLEIGRPQDLARSGIPELGTASAAEAETFLLGLARADVPHRAAGTGMMVATLVRGADPAPELLELARDRGLEREHRRSALFWVAQVASERIGPHLAGIAADEAEDQDVRDAAVFALSQRPDDEAVPALMELARTAPHAGTRRSALFWLAQQDDPRVPDFFAELILGRGG